MGARLTNRERGEFIHISVCTINHYENKGPGHSGARLAGPEPFWVPKG